MTAAVARETKEAAERIGLHPGTLANMRVYGGGPPFAKVGRKVLYRDCDVDAWLAKKVVRSTSEGVAA